MSLPVNSPVATFERSENVTIAHLVGAYYLWLEPEQLLAVRGMASAIISTGSKFILLPSGHAHGSNGQSSGYCLCIDYFSMICEHVLLIDDRAY